MNAVGFATTYDTAHPDVLDSIQCALRDCGYRDLRGLRCEYQDGTATIRGHVGSYFLKQMAQAVVGRVPGVTCINNQLHVS